MEVFDTIKEKVETQIIEKKSKFIATMYPVTSKEEVENRIKQIRKQYFDAKHHCVAYRIIEELGIQERCSDDGEPSGTAGAPMLALLRGSQLCNTLVVVTRYFGGILLGTGGLVRAYSQATQKAIQQATKIRQKEGKQMQITISYSEIESFRYYCRKNNIEIVQESYTNNAIFLVEISNEELDIMVNGIDKLNFNMIKMEEIGNKYIDVKIRF